MATTEYSFGYLLRPGYGSKDLLLEFNYTKNYQDLIDTLKILLEQNAFNFEGETGVILGDKVYYVFSSVNGKIVLSLDSWNFVFLMGENNQTDILRMDQILLDSGLFKKEETDFSKYQ